MEKMAQRVVSRRAFLKSAALGAAALAAAPLLAACGGAALAPTPAASKPAAAAPTKPAEPTKAPAAQPTAAPTKKVDFPQKGKAITIIVPFAAGIAADVGARVLAAALEKELGTSVEVVNRVGASGQVGATELAKAKPDGYTIGAAILPGIATLYQDAQRQTVFTRKSFQMLAGQVVDPALITVLSKSPYKTIKEMVDAAKAKPGQVSVTIGGVLGDKHFTVLLLEQLAGVEFNTVVQTDATTTFLGGHVDAYSTNAGSVLAHIKSGNARVLGVASESEVKFLPGVKTMKAQGYNFTMGAMRGYAAPAGVPKEIVDLLSGAIKKVSESQEFTKKMDEMALTVRYMSPTDFDAFWGETETQVGKLTDLYNSRKKK